MVDPLFFSAINVLSLFQNPQAFLKLVDFLCTGTESVSDFLRKRGKQRLQVEPNEETVYNIKLAF